MFEKLSLRISAAKSSTQSAISPRGARPCLIQRVRSYNVLRPILSVHSSTSSPTVTDPVRIAEIYSSLQGEGRLTGTPSVLVRTSGCNLRCWFCDTPFTSWRPEGEDHD